MKQNTLRITIDIAPTSERDYPADVIVQTEAFYPGEIADAVGVTWVGICTAINQYMQRRGCEDFDCLKHHEVINEGTSGPRKTH